MASSYPCTLLPARSYSWLPHTQLARIPVRSVAGRGALVAVWVTNNPRYLDYVQGPLFRKWGVAHVATWYWLKVCPDLAIRWPRGCACHLTDQ
jgi:hypothetical protein